MDTLQVKLSLDKGLREAWETLESRYKALGKSDIIRLAINDLAAKEKKYYDDLIQSVMDEIASRDDGMSFEDAVEWWNAN
jgi:hypothetical protein